VSFYARKFIFDGKPSHSYNLFITSIDTGAQQTSAGNNDVKLYEQFLYRRAKPILLGVAQNTILEFDVEFSTPEDLTAMETQKIEKWLFGQTGYKKLQILQADMQDAYFNCFLVSPSIYRVGNLIRGFRATVHCDAPWGWTFPKTKTYTTTSTTFINLSDNNSYLYPTVVCTMNTGGTFSIVNSREPTRTFSFTGLLANEVITIDNDKKIITSSTEVKRLSNFSKNWLRFVPGKNPLTFAGSFTSIQIIYQLAKKIA
jgi:hypothetical protein